MPRFKVRAELRDIVDLAEQAGWEVTGTGGGHLRFSGPDGQVVHHGSTSSDHRAVRNLRSQLRGAGLTIESKGYTPPKDKREKLAVVVGDLDPAALAGDEFRREVMGELDTEMRSDIYTLATLLYTHFEEEGHAQGDAPDPELIEFLTRGKGAMTTIGDRVRHDLDPNLLADICDDVFTKISQNVVSRNCDPDPERPGRWLYPFPLRGLIATVMHDKYTSGSGRLTAVTMAHYMDGAYRLLKTQQAGDPGAILLRRPDKTLGVSSLWSVADKWQAPRGIIVTLHRSGPSSSLALTNRERKLTPHEAGEDREPAPVTVITTKQEAPMTAVDTKPARGTRPKDPDNPPPTWQPREENDPEPWLCEEEGCDFRSRTVFTIQGHKMGHRDGDWHKRAIETREAKRREAKERAEQEAIAAERKQEQEAYEQARLADVPAFEPESVAVPTPEPATDIRAAVRDALLDLLAGGEGSAADKRRIAQLEESQDRWVTRHSEVCNERDEAVAALRLLLTDYINPRIVAGAIDVAKYIEPPAPGEKPIV